MCFNWDDMNIVEKYREYRLRQSWFSKQLEKFAAPFVWVWQAALSIIYLAGAALVLLTQPALDAFSIAIVIAAVLLGLVQAQSALLLKKGKLRGRSIAVIGNILAIAVFSFLTFQIANVIRVFNDMSQSFFDSFTGLLILASGVAWWVVAIRVVKRLSGDEEVDTLDPKLVSQLKFITGFKRLGQLLTLIGAIVFLIQFNPFSMIFSVLVSLVSPDPTALVTLLITLGSIVQMRALLTSSVSTKLRASQSDEERIAGWLFVSPSIIGFLAFLAGPLAYSLVMSFFKWDGINTPTFVGLKNYTDTLGLEFSSTRESLSVGYFQIAELFGYSVGAIDPLFWRSLTNIFIFLITAVPLAVIFALILATLIEQRLPGSKVFRAVFFIPSVAGVIGVTLIWKQMLNSSVGFFNYAIGEIFAVLNFFLPGDPLPTRVEIGWLSSEQWALAAVVVVFVWSQFGFNTVLYIAGLQSVSKELYEAAELDGASPFQRFWNVTIPALRPTTFFVTATTVIIALQLFDIVFALNQPNVVGFPNNATLTPVVYLYQLGFQQNNFGKASAVAWLLFAIIFIFTLLQFNRQRKQAEGS